MQSVKSKMTSYCFHKDIMGVFWFRQGARIITYKRVRSPNYVKNWKKINANSDFFAADAAIAA